MYRYQFSWPKTRFSQINNLSSMILICIDPLIGIMFSCYLSSVDKSLLAPNISQSLEKSMFWGQNLPKISRKFVKKTATFCPNFEI